MRNTSKAKNKTVVLTSFFGIYNVVRSKNPFFEEAYAAFRYYDVKIGGVGGSGDVAFGGFYTPGCFGAIRPMSGLSYTGNSIDEACEILGNQGFNCILN